MTKNFVRNFCENVGGRWAKTGTVRMNLRSDAPLSASAYKEPITFATNQVEPRKFIQ
jgi:hypothetical protein